jgi:hypothetical protein
MARISDLAEEKRQPRNSSLWYWWKDKLPSPPRHEENPACGQRCGARAQSKPAGAQHTPNSACRCYLRIDGSRRNTARCRFRALPRSLPGGAHAYRRAASSPSHAESRFAARELTRRAAGVLVIMTASLRCLTVCPALTLVLAVAHFAGMKSTLFGQRSYHARAAFTAGVAV